MSLPDFHKRLRDIMDEYGYDRLRQELLDAGFSNYVLHVLKWGNLEKPFWQCIREVLERTDNHIFIVPGDETIPKGWQKYLCNVPELEDDQ